VVEVSERFRSSRKTAMPSSPDIMMPGLDGIAVLRELRKRSETSTTPIVMVTTKSDEKNMTAALESGCTGYITKPFTRGELLEIVRDTLERNLEEAASE